MLTRVMFPIYGIGFLLIRVVTRIFLHAYKDSSPELHYIYDTIKVVVG